ncbi:alpha/beta-hydrolase family protein [Gordonia alkanivorans]|uniref:Membrane protein n=1 Tax=Gordonia alkanivorans CGMCC 6845 TaxID=1423140 RepID=W9DG85_9ACTN|nr:MULTISPECIES: alpha/beta-hydrolase family protein [Gordonia]ETA05426.1 membrane protein [Gordonia alkanivorans CGMCC 6845]MDH3024585.1 alpha/beta-hydrolase family protein [Gordonia alkanivorans]MDH3045255.1 alpha/beta-hydrolase family protein [Gordonia alkanivorans]WJG15368.1 alpha/beta-hydrolase family protein [Gordonia sp. Swx-4]
MSSSTPTSDPVAELPAEPPVEAPAGLGAESPADVESGDAARPAWWRRRLDRFSCVGLAVALVFLWLSMTPSLLPRGALFQGVVSGASAAVGYALGVFFSWLIRFMISRDKPWPAPMHRVWAALGLAAIAGTVVMLVMFQRWQDDIRTMMSVDLLSWTAYPQIAIICVVVFFLLILIGQAWGDGVVWLVRTMNRFAPPRISAVAAIVVAILVTVFVLNGVVANYGMKALNSTFASVNDETTADSKPPTSPLRSGGPGSLVTWDSLGRQGRIFVSVGPSVEELSAFNGAPAIEPIRAYVGLGSGDDLRANAKLAAEELERTGGLQRKVVAVASTTGTGWINQATVDSLEYMYNGDTATVSMQYSYLPSWLSFLVDKERARQAGQALFEAVSERVRAIPEVQRPKLVVFGESLGSFAAESAFGTIPSLNARTDGALFVGPTFNNSLWVDTTTNRDPGTPEWQPTYDEGRQVRFIADAPDLYNAKGEWVPGRAVYLQHASDPISWWSPRLILREPDWLNEARGRDVLPAMHWIPFVTFLQVSADMAVSTGVPDGHGHFYLAAIPAAWAEILQPPGWTPEKTEKLIPLLNRD